jgi:putative lumazine-binding protein
MTTAQLAADTQRITDHDAIAEVVGLYIDGAAQGDAEKLRRAFHPDAQMYGAVGATRFDIPIAQFIDMAVEHPGDVDGTFRGRILSITQAGDAACATVAEDGFWGRLSFVDFFTVNRIDDRWQITNKTFAHTGGEMPAE